MAIGVDQAGAAILFNRPGLTISSLCRVVEFADAGIPEFQERLRSLKLSAWQIDLLRWLGKRLDGWWPGHCEGARLGDLDRAKFGIDLLTAPLK
ncbi:MAG: hypothetical protein ACRD41_05840 [Candidatus Acidiferrales bacterium]